LYKHWVHEGGISTPLIVHWPSRIRDGGAIRGQCGHLIDIMPTCLEAAGAVYPAEYGGHRISPMAGRSLLPAFDNHPIKRPEGLFWEHEGNRAVWKDHYKLVSRFKQPWELYDLTKDRSEMHDLSSDQPEQAEKLRAMYDAWAKRSQVIAWEQLNAPRQKQKPKS
jgi:arylsulfatase